MMTRPSSCAMKPSDEIEGHSRLQHKAGLSVPSIDCVDDIMILIPESNVSRHNLEIRLRKRKALLRQHLYSGTRMVRTENLAKKNRYMMTLTIDSHFLVHHSAIRTSKNKKTSRDRRGLDTSTTKTMPSTAVSVCPLRTSLWFSTDAVPKSCEKPAKHDFQSGCSTPPRTLFGDPGDALSSDRSWSLHICTRSSASPLASFTFLRTRYRAGVGERLRVV